MISVFAYGVLAHPPILEVVLDASAEDIVANENILRDYRLFSSNDGMWANLRPHPSDAFSGTHVQDLTPRDRDRIDFYMEVHGCLPNQKFLGSYQHASVHLPGTRDPETENGEPWLMRDWTQRWGPLQVEIARIIMEQFGQTDARHVAEYLPRIRVQAQSRLLAKSSRHGETMPRLRVDVQNRHRAYAGFFALDELTLRHGTFAGEMTAPLNRAVFIATDSAIVLPYDPWSDEVLLVDQFRVGPLARGDGTAWLAEPVAGLIDAGETPQETARREASEEAFVHVLHLEPVSEGYASPGHSTECQYIYVGICHIHDREDRIGGLGEEDEDIRSRVIPFDALLDLADQQLVANTPLALAAYWLARHRDRLRSDHAGDKS